MRDSGVESLRCGPLPNLTDYQPDIVVGQYPLKGEFGQMALVLKLLFGEKVVEIQENLPDPVYLPKGDDYTEIFPLHTRQRRQKHVRVNDNRNPPGSQHLVGTEIGIGIAPHAQKIGIVLNCPQVLVSETLLCSAEG